MTFLAAAACASLSARLRGAGTPGVPRRTSSARASPSTAGPCAESSASQAERSSIRSAATWITAGRRDAPCPPHSFASIANDLGFTEVTIAALVGHSKGSVTSKYIHTVDTALIMAADTISGYIQGLLDGIEFKQTAYALDRSSRKAALARFLLQASVGGEPRNEQQLAA